ncbi:MAG: hypothetical protein ACI9MC_000318 [Kiritimatiellia bacterium]|jgi:uncharacterized protein (TIGR02453 family)
MSYVFPRSALTFLSDLADNNSKEWMDANRKRYERELREPSRELVDNVNDLLHDIAPEWASAAPRKHLSRINRDIRFSKDKTPYNTRVWAGFTKEGSPKGTGAGLYFGLSTSGLGVGLGTWKPSKETASALRATIDERHDELRSILTDLASQGDFNEMGGDAYKRVPKPYAADHPAADWLKLKSVHLRSVDFSTDVVCSDQILPTIESRMVALLPLLHFVHEGMQI